jgi:hypothetical protein
MKFTSSHILAIVIAMLSYLLWQYVTGGPGNIVVLKASDGNLYKVQDLPGKKDAAELMASIHRSLSKIVDYYRQDEYISDEPARLLVERFNPRAFMENTVTSSDTSYSENKGDKIVLCLRDKTAPPDYPLIDTNTVMFVVLHEMAHLMTAELNGHKHTREFWANFLNRTFVPVPLRDTVSQFAYRSAK